MKLYTDWIYQDAKHLTFNNEVEVDSLDEFIEVVKYDHIFGKLKGLRNKSNWSGSDVLFADVDNSHSEDPDDWISIDEFKSIFKDFEFYTSTSKSHMIEKDDKPARPKFHIYFPIKIWIDNRLGFEKLLTKLIDIGQPYFDKSIKNCDRLFYGNKTAEVFHNPGDSILKNIIKHKIHEEEKKYHREELDFSIGNRNTHFLKLGVRMYKAGIDQNHIDEYISWFNSKLKNPLDEHELHTILKQSYKYGTLK